jgi:hypothetical protein
MDGITSQNMTLENTFIVSFSNWKVWQDDLQLQISFQQSMLIRERFRRIPKMFGGRKN